MVYVKNRVNAVNGMKFCSTCEETKPVAEFNKQPGVKDGLRRECRECESKRFKAFYATNLQTQRARDRKRYPTEREMRSNAHYKRKYGISIEEYQRMLEQQNGVCAICHQAESVTWKGRAIPLAVDHCHKTGKVRGLLCNRCNRVLSLFDDDIEVMKSAINYLHR
jgi:Autographiviridae endonuclease VII